MTSTGAAASYEFRAESAGILTVVIRATDEIDLVLAVTDADGQNLPEGRSDRDLGGDSGAEQFAVTLPRAGTYYVKVEPFGSG
ncbi:pre-peptidase C-terminal domain-containing protein, partial [Shewanella sp. A25]|nr:pre-peptidase C-terminal domain-containing protein [Shewanella shenzhenensis]